MGAVSPRPSGAPAPDDRLTVVPVSEWSDDELHAALASAGLLVGGPGGPGPGEPSGGGGGGGDGDDDWEWTPRHHSPVVRAVALVMAAALILGSTGAWVAVALEAQHPDYAATVTAVARGGTGVDVSVLVTNDSGRVGKATCIVEAQVGDLDEDATFHTPLLAARTSLAQTVQVPFSRSAMAGAAASPPLAAAACGPA